MFLKKILILIALLFTSFVFVKNSFAQEFKSDYKVDYFLKKEGEAIDTEVRFAIKITNLENDVYVSKFALAFPKSFIISDLTALDDKGNINPVISEEANKAKIELEFSNPETGKGTQNNFFLNFKQKNLFKINGNVWEVVLPTVSTKENEKYQVVVHLPEGTDKKISIAKPRPDLIQGNSIYWNDSKAKTIYAVFGESQIYKTKLVYNLKNSRLTPVYTDIAFPPDTINQKVFVDSVSEAPATVFQDEDGNFLARYNLKPKESKKIVLTGFVEVFSQYRSELKRVDSDRLTTQRKYLFNESKYWKINSPNAFSNIKSPNEIYNYLVTNFKYDYSRVNKSIERLGADNALRNPAKAVCTEFSDSFVAIAREKGIMAREIQGYGFSQDALLRPLSLIADLLHSWPQYYDENKQLWISVDPTWENTSGIDYFTSLDLNHIVFAIHGKKPDYPLPAGAYKFEDTKDVEIEPVKETPQERKKTSLGGLRISKSTDKNRTYMGKFWVRNEGNVYIYNLPIQIQGKNLAITEPNGIITSLAPFEKKELEFGYQVFNTKGEPQITISTPYGESLTKQVKIFPYAMVIIVLVAIVLISCSVVIYLRFFYKRS